MTFLSYGESHASSDENCDALGTAGNGKMSLYVIADGAGKRKGAAEAANIAVSETIKWFYAVKGLDFTTRTHFELYTLVDKLDHLIGSTLNGAQTTFVVLIANGSQMIGVCVGNSEAWGFDNDTNRIDFTANKMKGYLGTGSATRTLAYIGPLAQPQRLALVTDGIVYATDAGKLNATLSNPDLKEGVKEAIKLTQMASGGFQDDVTVLLADKKGQIS